MCPRQVHLSYAGQGIYSLPEAARLVGTNTTRIRRWLLGYRFPSRTGEQRKSERIFAPQLPVIDHHWSIGFLDLVELLFIKAFRDHGVTLPTIRQAAKVAADRWRTHHPFCLKRFATDGRTIFEAAIDEAGDEQVLELTRHQYAFAKVVKPYFKQLEFGVGDNVDRWWPAGNIYLDPRIAFGRAVVHPYGIPTETLYDAYLANGSTKEVGRWYSVPAQIVRRAVNFEESLAA